MAEEALKIDPSQPRANNVLGYISLRIDKKKDVAEKHFRTAADAKADDYYSRFALGYIMTQTGREAEALPLFERSIEIYPRNTTDSNVARQSPYHLLAGMYEDRKEPKKAVAVYQKAFDIDHTDYKAAKHLGMLRLDAGDPKGAVKAFERCFEINPFEVSVHLAAGEAAAKCGLHDVAAREYGVGLYLDPKRYTAAFGLATALKALGRRPEALEAARKALEIEPDSDEAKALIGSLK